MYFTNNQFIRGVAQPGSAPRSGRGGRQFESGHPDQSASCKKNGCFKYPVTGILMQVNSA